VVAMGNVILPKDHYSREISTDIASICEPLKEYGIVYFNYSRIFKDGSAFVMTNHWDSLHHHCEKQYKISPPIPKNLQIEHPYYIPTFINNDGPAENFAFFDYQTLFNLGCPIFFIEQYPEFVDLFIYGGTGENNLNIINTYLIKIQFLEKFKSIFRDKARKLIDKSSQNLITLPSEMYCDFFDIKMGGATIDDKKTIEQLNAKHYPFYINNQPLSITFRQLEVIEQLNKGCSVKETAKAINISPKTVETHLENIRRNFGVHKKSDIIKILTKARLL
jgi:DNA-binding CsgD family transcriptional regulator